MNFHVLYVLEHETSMKNSVCLYVCLSVCMSVCLSIYMSVCLSVCLYVRTYVDSGCGRNNFREVSRSKQNLVGLFYVWNVHGENC